MGLYISKKNERNHPREVISDFLRKCQKVRNSICLFQKYFLTFIVYTSANHQIKTKYRREVISDFISDFFNALNPSNICVKLYLTLFLTFLVLFFSGISGFLTFFSDFLKFSQKVRYNFTWVEKPNKTSKLF
jgi:hypothetical protein